MNKKFLLISIAAGSLLAGGASAGVADSYRECIGIADTAYCDSLFPKEFVYENGSRFVRGKDGLYFYEYVGSNGKIVRDERVGAGYPTIGSIVEDLSRGPSLPPGHKKSCPCGSAKISLNSCEPCPPAYFPPPKAGNEQDIYDYPLQKLTKEEYGALSQYKKKLYLWKMDSISNSRPRPEDYIYPINLPRPTRAVPLSHIAPSRTRYTGPRITPGSPANWIRDLFDNLMAVDSGSGLGPRSGGDY